MFIIVIIAVLLFISSFFSLAETGITAASRSKIYRLKLEGSKRAGRVIELLDRKDRLITTILLVNTAVNAGASALTTAFFMATFGNESETILYATGIMTISILIFSEVLPKVFALKNPEKVALLTAPIVQMFMLILAPITFVAEVIVAFFLRVLGLEKHGMEGVVHGIDALRGAVEFYHSEGDVVKEDKDMLGGVLDLDDTEISSVMKHRKDMESIDLAHSQAEIVTEVLKSQYSRVPVYSGSPENIVGILHSKSLMQALADNAGDASKIDIRSLLMEPWYVPESTSLKEQLIAFREKRQHFALVVDEYGSLMGIITLEDILEEIVGNIHDEYDVDSHVVEDNLDGTFMIDGTMPVRDLNREMNWNLPGDIANTVAGLIITEAQMIPAKGQAFHFYDFRFEIVKKKRNQITKIKVSRVK